MKYSESISNSKLALLVSLKLLNYLIFNIMCMLPITLIFTDRWYTFCCNPVWQGWHLLLLWKRWPASWPCFPPWQHLAGQCVSLSRVVKIVTLSIGSQKVIALRHWQLTFTFFWQKYIAVNPQLSSLGGEEELSSVRETIQQLLRWGWKYNKNLEEQAAQLHMLTSWSQIVEVKLFHYSFYSLNMYPE